MSIHDIPTTRQKAAAILGGRKLQMLEEAGLMVVPVSLMKRMDLALQLAPWPSAIDNDLYTDWYEVTLSPVWSDVSGELREVIEAREGFLSKQKVYEIREARKDEPSRTHR